VAADDGHQVRNNDPGYGAMCCSLSSSPLPRTSAPTTPL